MLSVIVPTYNERENVLPIVERTLTAFGRMPEPAELLFVDDNSPDGTAEAIRTLAVERGESERVRVLVRTRDRGLAKAVVAGFQAARGDVLAVMDADMSHPPEVLPDMLRAIRAGADIAVASRYVAGGGTEGWPLRRRIVSRVACWLALGLTRVRDATSGYFALRRAALAGVEIVPRGYKIGLEVFARLRGARMTEVPFVFTDRRYGSSKLTGSVMAAYLVQLATLYRARFPLLLGYMQFGMVGTLGMVVDAVVFGFALYLLGLAGVEPRVGGFSAQTVSFLGAAAFNFWLNGAWTFRDRSQGAKFRMFLAVSAVGFVLRSLVFLFVLSLPLAAHPPGPWLGQEWLALVSGILVASVWNYFGSLRWAFRGGPRPVSDMPEPEPMRLIGRTTAIYGAVALLMLGFAALRPLAYDEAYYWQWSRHLAWGYYDHPPMVAFLIAAGTRLLGVSELGVRFVPLIAALAIPWMMRDLARRLWDDPRAPAWALAAGIALPLLAVGMTVVTPDIPLVFFWAATLVLTLRAFERERLGDWALAGAAMGFGLLGKYPMVLLYPALLAALLVSPRGRRALCGPGPYVAVLVSLVLFAPNLWWQLHQDGEGILYQLQHGFGQAAGAGHDAPGLNGLGVFVAGQIFVISPILFVLFLLVFARVTWRFLHRGTAGVDGLRQSVEPGALSARELLPFVIFPALVPFAVFAGASLLAKSHSNWMAPVYVTGTVLLAGELARYTARGASRWRRRLAWSGVGLAVLMSLYVHIEAVAPLAPYPESVVTQTWGHEELAAWVSELEATRTPGESPRILASDYKLASVLAFYLPGRPEPCVPFESGSGSAYHAWQQAPPPGARALFLSRRPLKSTLRVFEDEVVELGEHRTVRKGRVVQRTWAYLGVPRADICAN